MDILYHNNYTLFFCHLDKENVCVLAAEDDEASVIEEEKENQPIWSNKLCTIWRDKKRYVFVFAA